MRTKVCSKCKIDKPANEFTPRKDRPVGLYSCCRECKAKSSKVQITERRRCNPKRQWAMSATSDARYRSNYTPDTVTVNDILLLLEDAHDLCAYCDRLLNFNTGMILRSEAPSLDQIEPKTGYHLANVVICCYRCNQIKSDATPQEMRQVADRVEKLIEIRKKNDFGNCRN